MWPILLALVPAFGWGFQGIVMQKVGGTTANLTVMLSNEMNGLAVGWTLSQMNVIVATLGGLFILKEKKTKKEMAFVIAGMILIALGGILIGITKNA